MTTEILPDPAKRQEYLDKGYCSAVHPPSGRWCVLRHGDHGDHHIGLYVDPYTKRFSMGFAVINSWVDKI